MLTDQEIIYKLWDTGHFFCPEALDIETVTEPELDELTPQDPVVKVAVKSYQGFMAMDLDRITAKLGVPRKSHDGSLDNLAARDLFEVPRCGHPDFLPPSFQWKLGAVGTGSWPQPCQKAGVKVHIDRSAAPNINLDAVIADCFKAYAEIGVKLIQVATKAEANIQVWWTTLAGSTIGIAEFNSQRCNDVVTCRFDRTYSQYMRSLMLHEWGHNMNLQHTRGGIMNPSVVPDPSPFRWPTTDPSYPVLVRYFGGEPIEPTPVPNPNPNPPPTPPPITDGKLDLPIILTDGKGRKFSLVLLPTTSNTEVVNPQPVDPSANPIQV